MIKLIREKIFGQSDHQEEAESIIGDGDVMKGKRAALIVYRNQDRKDRLLRHLKGLHGMPKTTLVLRDMESSKKRALIKRAEDDGNLLIFDEYFFTGNDEEGAINGHRPLILVAQSFALVETRHLSLFDVIFVVDIPSKADQELMHQRFSGIYGSKTLGEWKECIIANVTNSTCLVVDAKRGKGFWYRL